MIEELKFKEDDVKLLKFNKLFFDDNTFDGDGNII